MVGRTSGRDSGESGQLILVGALALAFILLGVVIVVNGVQYTQTTSSKSATQETSDTAVVEVELERGVEGLIDRQGSGTTSDLEGEIENFVEYYARIEAETNPVSIHVQNVDCTTSTCEVSYKYDSTDVSRDAEFSVSLP